MYSKRFKKIVKRFVGTMLVLLTFLTNVPFGAVDLVIEKIGERKIIDSLWLAQNDSDVVDSWGPKKAEAAEVLVDATLLDTTDEYGPSPSVVFTSDQVGYVFYMDAAAQDLAYSKTTNGGTNWGAPVIIDTAVAGWTGVAVWYDQWTPGDTTGTKIHIAAVDDANDDVYYTFLDTAADTLKGSMVSAIAQTAYTEAADGPPSITKGAGGALFISGNFTTTAGGYVAKSTDGAGNSWTNVTPASWSSVAIDQIQLLPLSTDNDIIAIKAQTADNTIRYRIYDEVGDVWDGAWSSSIATLTENTTYDQWFSATIKKSTGDVYLAFANNTNNAANDIEFWTFDESVRSGFTQGGNVMTNDATVMMPVPLMDESDGDIYVAYLRGTLNADMGVYFKKSTDGGATWGSESVRLHGLTDDHKSLRGNLLSSNRLGVVYYDDDDNDLFFSTIDDNIETTIDDTILDGTDEYGPSPNTVFVNENTGYVFYIDATSQDLAYKKTTNGGKNWSLNGVVIDTAVTGWTSLAVWYDRWTPGDTTGTKIHIAAADDTADDIYYTFLDTAADTLKGSVVAAVSGTTAYTEAADGPPSITKGAGGALFISGNFTTTAGGKVSKSTDGAGAIWTDVTPASWSSVAIDQIQLLPLSTDNDIIAIKAQTADNTIRHRIYDEVGDAWEGAWSASIGSLTENTTYDQWFSASIKKSTGNVYLAFANNTNNAANDINFFTFTDSGRTWTQNTDVVTNSSTTMMPAVVVDEDTGYLYTAYLRGTLAATMQVYYKYSTDGGTTWSSESISMSPGIVDDHKALRGNLLSGDRLYVTWFNDDLNDIMGTTIPMVTAVATTPTVSTDAEGTPTQTTVTLNGSISDNGGADATEHGFAWSTNSGLSSGVATTTGGAFAGTGSFTSGTARNLTGLTCNTTYYYRAYATNSGGTGYGTIEQLTTSACNPTVTTDSPTVATSITQTTATLNGNISSTGGASVTTRGFAYSTNSGLTTGVSTTTDNGTYETGAFTGSATSLTCNTTYYARAYATNSAGTSFGAIVSFVTSPCNPTIDSSAATSVSTTGATLNGNITNTGGANATVRGFAYSTNSGLSTGVSTTTNNGSFSSGAFDEAVSGLSCGTTYYFRAYATNTSGTGFGSILNFDTTACPTTTLGDGTDGGNSTVGPGGSATEIDRFSLVTSTGTDTLTGLTVTLGPSNAYTNIETVGIYTTSDDLQCSATPSSNSVAVTGCNIGVTTSAIEYIVKITPKSHAGMPATPGASYATVATVTAITVTNPTAGTDTDSATITVDNASPAQVVTSTATPSSTQVSLAWTNPADSDLDSVVVLRGTARITTAPTEGATYSVGNSIGSATVICVETPGTTTCSDTGLTNGTSYHYEIFAKDSRGNYSLMNPNNELLALSQTSRSWRGLAVSTSTKDVYATVQSGDIYKQTAGSGNFTALSQTSRSWYGVSIDSENSNVYAAVVGGDIYKQTAGSGNFVGLSQTSRQWVGIAVDSYNKDVYAVVSSGDIYKQTAGSGNFVGLSQTSRLWQGIAVDPDNKNVYATVSSGDIYKMTGGSGNFVALNQIPRLWRDITVDHITKDVYATVSSGDIYIQVGGTGDFIPMNQTYRLWQGIAVDPDTRNIYASVSSGDIYKMTDIVPTVSPAVPRTIPTVTTTGTIPVTQSTQTLLGNITNTGGQNAHTRGFAYSTDSGLSTGVSTTTANGSFGVAAFNGSATSLTCDTTYYYRAYATNFAGTGYGTIESFVPQCVTSVGNGTNPSNSTVGPGDSAVEINRFTLSTNSGTDNITGFTIQTLSFDGGYDLVGSIEIQTIAGGTLCSASNPSSSSVSITGCSIDVTTTPVEYKIMLTPKSHVAMPTSGIASTIYSYVSGITSSTGNFSSVSDSSATVTIDNMATDAVDSMVITEGDSQNSLTWVNPANTDLGSVIVVASTSPITFVPVEGTSYATSTIAGDSRIACSGLQESCVDLGLTNGTGYYYKIFTRDTRGNYQSYNTLQFHINADTNVGGLFYEWGALAADYANNDLYIADSYGSVYKQTNSFGNLVFSVYLDDITFYSYGLAIDSSNQNVYAALNPGLIYKQTGATGAFASLLSGSHAWRSVDVDSSNQNVYAVDYGGDIYKQTAGSGTFNALSQTSRNWSGIDINENNDDVYATVLVGDIYKQTAGSGNFTALSQTTRNWSAIAVDDDSLDVYATVSGGDIYKQTAGSGNFTALGFTSISWFDIEINQSTKTIYAISTGGEIYKIHTDPLVSIVKTPKGKPTVTTNSASSVTGSAATLNGNITSIGGVSVTTRGFAYSTNSSLTSGVSTTTDNGTYGTGTFTHDLSSLDCGTTYYFRAYATNTQGTGFGGIQSLSTNACAVNLTISSETNQLFSSGSPAIPISTITITEDTTAVITAANDLRIAIATSSVDVRWFISDTTATIGGTASGKVSNSVTYEGDGSVLVIPVNTNFAGGDTLTISGLSFANFGSANTPVPALYVLEGGPSDITAYATDDKTIAIKGRLVLGSHTAGQEDNKFYNSSSVTNGELYAFQLAPSGEVVSVTNLILRLTGIVGLNVGNFANSKLFIDYAGDGSVGANDLEVGTGQISINSTTGSITFATDFNATTTRNYIFRTDVSNINPFNALNVSLNISDIVSSGVTSLIAISPTGIFDHASHVRIPQGVVVSDEIVGAGITVGGGGGGGEVIGDDPLLLRPTTHSGALVNAGNAYDGVNTTYATTVSGEAFSDYKTFNFTVPNGNTIDGIEVKIEASESNGGANSTIDAQLSWNNGGGFTSVKTASLITGTDTVFTLGGGSDTWGRTWSGGEFSNGNFVLRITGRSDQGSEIRIDDIKVKVHHRSSGGGSGGGGDIGLGDRKNLLASVINIFEFISKIFSLK